jgi:hypothetical protein
LARSRTPAEDWLGISGVKAMRLFRIARRRERGEPGFADFADFERFLDTLEFVVAVIEPAQLADAGQLEAAQDEPRVVISSASGKRGRISRSSA